MILSDLLPDILGRVEENVENGPIFWSLAGEVYVSMVDAMFEAALMSGVVQLPNVSVSLGAGSTYYSIQGPPGFGGGGFGQMGFGTIVPQGIIAPLRMRAPSTIRKTTINALDTMIPGWQQADPSDQIIAWFPLGTSGIGIYPQLADDSTVVMDFLCSPVNETRPYTGAEVIPFQAEFADAFSQYGAAYLRAKEGGAEAEEADVVFQAFMSNMKSLSAFQTRIDSLVYSGAFGAGMSNPNPRKVV